MNLRTATGRALYALPGGVRRAMPAPVRDAVRRRVGPFAPWEDGFDHRPPEPEAGTCPAPPDFVGIGAQKAGTTWWYDLISDHPDVHRRAEVHKERHFFGRFATAAFAPRDVADYHGWFARPLGTCAGEWTPDYMAQPWTAPLLAKAAPDARLLVLLRHPVDRFVSGLAHAERHGATDAGDVVTDAFGRGLYAAALEPWLRCFPGHHLLVLQYERCRADAAGELARTYRFLGLDDGFRPAALGRPASAPSGTRPTLAAEARERLVDLYRSDVERLRALVPDLDLELWPGFGPGA
jgi:hypothetical protein